MGENWNTSFPSGPVKYSFCSLAVMAPVFRQKEYQEFPGTQVRRMTEEEIEKYMDERQVVGTCMPD